MPLRHPTVSRAPYAIGWVLTVFLCTPWPVLAQNYSATPTSPFVSLNAGPDAMAGIDFVQYYLDQQNRDSKAKEKRDQERKELIASGTLSALDLDAPNNAIEQYNQANTLLKAQKSKEAIPHLQKAIADYPKFVLAHNGLGLAYLDQDDSNRAKIEFETAARLDDKFAGSFLNLGRLDLATKEFPEAQSNLEKAASLRPKDVAVLSALAIAEDQNHHYQEALDTTNRIHALDHKGRANVHYVAAAAAQALNDPDTMERELKFLVAEDPANAYAPNARKNLDIIAHNREVRLQASNTGGPQQANIVSDSPKAQSIPNSDRLKTQLGTLSPETSAEETCAACTTPGDNSSVASAYAPAPMPASTYEGGSGWTIRKNIDQVALFFAVSSHGHMVNDLEASDIQISDDSKPPEQILEFAPQSKLPLRLALLVDTSGSVHDRFSFEKHAAAKFLEKVLVNPADLAFVAGFSTEPLVTQDFTSDQAGLAKGVDQLSNGGGTALFDAVSYACQKLGEYPDGDRVAKVLVVLSDGEDNSSHTSLKQTIQAEERTGVTVYAISTREDLGDKTDADKILEALAERSGGEAMFPRDVPTLNKSFEKLRDLIRSRYFVAYKPANFEPNGSYRAIHILAKRNGQRLQVRARDGYHARLQTQE